MEKELKTAGELHSLINRKIRDYDVCKDVSVASVNWVDDPSSGSNWTIGHFRSSGTQVLPECKRAIYIAMHELQQKYELELDD